ncbi:MAG: hypothetical protein KAJ19_12205 [Gammaproteobacteria bacterium]|nr:hypothetical protein [Gammaproteobacteria bacterium]
MTSHPGHKANIDMLSQLLTDSLHLPDPQGRVRAELEKQANDVWKKRFSYKNNLGTMNKLILARTVSTFQPAIPTTAPPKQPQSRPIQKFPDKRYEEHKKHFAQTINATRPKEIDFRDKVDDNPIESGTIDETMRAREAELKNIMSGYQSDGAKEWLTSEATAPRPPTNIKIDRESSIPGDMVPVQNVEEKHVTFSIPEPPKEEPRAPSTFNLLSKLKRVPSSDGPLNELLANQKIILERLDSIEAHIIAGVEKCQGTVDEPVQSTEPI